MTILSNSIYNHDKLGIDLGNNGVTHNMSGGPHARPNDGQNFPVLSRAANTGSASFIQGTLNSTPLTSFRVEFFANTTLDPTSYGEGQTYLGATMVTTDASGNTSEFAQDIVVGSITLSPPVAGNHTYSVAENAGLTVPALGVLANDSDPNGLPITATLVSGPGHGTLTLNANGSFSYTPAQNVYGSDSFTYQASDGGAASGTATVTLNVNSPPTLATIPNQTTTIGQAFTVTLSASDPDHDTRTFTARADTLANGLEQHQYGCHSPSNSWTNYGGLVG